MADDEQAARRHAKRAPERLAAYAEAPSMGEIWLRVTGSVSKAFFGRLAQGVKGVASALVAYELRARASFAGSVLLIEASGAATRALASTLSGGLGAESAHEAPDPFGAR
jgi:hypothetical protein